ncbi:MAG: GNAT family N-acetyltransferase [Eubacteriales bacterium]|nr:GNAT family N-acetyltransferase [Eubacteriales bacterium]
MHIRRFQVKDAEEVSILIATTLRTTNAKDYTSEYIEKEVASLQPENILERASWTHFYVVCDNDKIVGCGAIGPYWGKEDESSLFTIFVLPSYQGKGIGTEIIQTLERDEYFLRAKRVEIPASITGTPFYRKMGYDYKNGIKEPDAEGLLRLEKFR